MRKNTLKSKFQYSKQDRPAEKLIFMFKIKKYF